MWNNVIKPKCQHEAPNYIYDEACLNIYNLRREPIQIYGQYEECDGCDYQDLGAVLPNQIMHLVVNTKYALQMHYKYNESILCPWKQNLLEHYKYGWNLTENCQPLYYIKEAAWNSYIPIFVACLIFMFIGLFWYLINLIRSRSKNYCPRLLLDLNGSESDLGTAKESTLSHSNRVKSVDVFRGICILLMIFVNLGGGKYFFFQHSVWNGITFADLVFPWFLWIMGLTITLTFSRKLGQGTRRPQLIIQVIKRSLILIALGVVLKCHTSLQSLPEFRFCGVLQRLGVCYLIVGILEATFAKLPSNKYQNGCFCAEILSALPQWSFAVTLVIIHICTTFLLDVPGCGRGYLGPGGLHDHANFTNCTGGAAGYIDRYILGNHIFNGGQYKKIYEASQDSEPQGILGTLTAVFLVFLGVHAGRILLIYSCPKDKVIRLIISGVVLCLLAASLCKCSKNDGIIPVNKILFSLSFTVLLAGFASLIFAFLHVIVDVMRKWDGRPFFYPGMNSLVLYLGHRLFAKTLLFDWALTRATHTTYLIMNLWGTIFWLCISICMYKNKIFLSV